MHTNTHRYTPIHNTNTYIQYIPKHYTNKAYQLYVTNTQYMWLLTNTRKFIQMHAINTNTCLNTSPMQNAKSIQTQYIPKMYWICIMYWRSNTNICFEYKPMCPGKTTDGLDSLEPILIKTLIPKAALGAKWALSAFDWMSDWIQAREPENLDENLFSFTSGFRKHKNLNNWVGLAQILLSLFKTVMLFFSWIHMSAFPKN